MKKIIHLTLFLAIIAAIAGGALGLANNTTAPIIAENELAAEKESLDKIYENAKFVIVEKNVSDSIEKIFEAKGKGYIYKMKVAGYKDGTSFLVALDKNGKIVKYVTINNGDTKGIGSKVSEPTFQDSLVDKDATNNELMNDTISGATISSKPILEGIMEAANYQADHLD